VKANAKVPSPTTPTPTTLTPTSPSYTR
jgi:hypothetical protein